MPLALQSASPLPHSVHVCVCVNTHTQHSAIERVECSVYTSTNAFVCGFTNIRMQHNATDQTVTTPAHISHFDFWLLWFTCHWYVIQEALLKWFTYCTLCYKSYVFIYHFCTSARRGIKFDDKESGIRQFYLPFDPFQFLPQCLICSSSLFFLVSIYSLISIVGLL